MRAAKWNTECERGGVWLRRVRRRSTDGNLVLAAPCRLLITRADGTIAHDLTGAVSGDGLTLELRLSETQTQALDPGQYEHKLTVTDPEIGGLVVLARGYFTVYDSAEQL